MQTVYAAYTVQDCVLGVGQLLSADCAQVEVHFNVRYRHLPIDLTRVFLPRVGRFSIGMDVGTLFISDNNLVAVYLRLGN